MNIVEKAEMVAEILHCRQSHGENDYIQHLKDVHDVLVRFGFEDVNLLAAGLLHDALEDSVIKYSLIKKYFNEDVAELVYCVTHELGRNRDEKNKKTYGKIAENPRAVVLKLADRIANVESGIKNGSDMVDKYRSEYESFRKNLYSRPSDMQSVRYVNGQEEMWSHLQHILFGR